MGWAVVLARPVSHMGGTSRCVPSMCSLDVLPPFPLWEQLASCCVCWLPEPAGYLAIQASRHPSLLPAAMTPQEHPGGPDSDRQVARQARVDPPQVCGAGRMLGWGRSGAGVDGPGWEGVRACLRLAAIRMCCWWRRWEHAAAPGMQLAACSCCQLPLGSPLLQPPANPPLCCPPACPPVCPTHRTAADISAAQEVDISKLRDPQPDDARVKDPNVSGAGRPAAGFLVWLLPVLPQRVSAGMVGPAAAAVCCCC